MPRLRNSYEVLRPAVEPLKSRGRIAGNFEVWLAKMGLGGSKVKNSAARIFQGLAEEANLKSGVRLEEANGSNIDQERAFLQRHVAANPSKLLRTQHDLSYALTKLTDRLEPSQLAKIEINYVLHRAQDHENQSADLFGNALTSVINTAVLKNKPKSGLLLEARLTEGIKALSQATSHSEKKLIISALRGMREPVKQLLLRAKRDQFGYPTDQVADSKTRAKNAPSLTFLKDLPYHTLREAAINYTSYLSVENLPDDRWILSLLQNAATTDRKDAILPAEGEFFKRFTRKAIQATGNEQKVLFSDLKRKGELALQHLQTGELFSATDPALRRQELVDSFALLHLDSLTNQELVQAGKLYNNYLKESALAEGTFPEQDFFLELLATTSMRKARGQIGEFIDQSLNKKVEFFNCLQGETVTNDVMKTFLSGSKATVMRGKSEEVKKELTQKLEGARTISEKIAILKQEEPIGTQPLWQFTADLVRGSYLFRGAHGKLSSIIAQPIYINDKKVAESKDKKMEGSKLSQGHKVVIDYLKQEIPDRYTADEKERIANAITFFTVQTNAVLEKKAAFLLPKEAADENIFQPFQLHTDTDSLPVGEQARELNEAGEPVKGRYYSTTLSDNQVVFSYNSKDGLVATTATYGDNGMRRLDSEQSTSQSEYTYALSYEDLLNGPKEPSKIKGFLSVRGQMIPEELGREDNFTELADLV